MTEKQENYSQENGAADLTSAMVETLVDSNLLEVSVDFGEAILDSFLEDGFAGDIPVIGAVFGLAKYGIAVKERLFLKKILYFLSEIAEIEPSKRAQMISKIEASEIYGIKVGEKLLFIIDKTEDHEHSQIIGQLFAAFLSNQISYDLFLRAARAVQNTYILDFWQFVKDDTKYWPAAEVGHLIASGLCDLSDLEIRVEDQWDHKSSEKYIVEGGELIAYITEVGENIRIVLRRHVPRSVQNDT